MGGSTQSGMSSPTIREPGEQSCHFPHKSVLGGSAGAGSVVVPKGACRSPLEIRKNPPLLAWKEEGEHPIRHERVQKLPNAQSRYVEDRAEGALTLNRP